MALPSSILEQLFSPVCVRALDNIGEGILWQGKYQTTSSKTAFVGIHQRCAFSLFSVSPFAVLPARWPHHHHIIGGWIRTKKNCALGPDFGIFCAIFLSRANGLLYSALGWGWAACSIEGWIGEWFFWKNLICTVVVILFKKKPDKIKLEM